jgi:hypothetical protein
MPQSRFVITRPYATSGLGCNLLSMAAALYVCERTKRDLIVDWTAMSELRDPAVNYFLAFFEPIRRWRDVKVTYVNDPEGQSAAYDLERCRQPEKSEFASLATTHDESRDIYLHAYHYAALELSGESPAEVFRYTKAFYAALTPRPHLVARLAAERDQFEGRLVVGLNVRTGNGEFARVGAYHRRINRTIFDRPDFVARLQRACDDCAARFPRALRDAHRVFVVTDCEPMQAALLKIPGAFAVRRRFPPPGAGHQFAQFDGEYSDVDSVNETIVDMLLMAQCHGLACNYTEYNRYAQYMTSFFCGNVNNIERYFEGSFRRAARLVKGLRAGAR